MNRMVFDVSTLGYIQKTQALILDYRILIRQVDEEEIAEEDKKEMINLQKPVK